MLFAVCLLRVKSERDMRSGKLLSRCCSYNTGCKQQRCCAVRGGQAGLRRYRSLWEIVGKQGGLGSLFGVISWRCFGFWSKQRIKPRSGSITGHRFLGGRSDHLIICRGNGLGRGERREKAMLLQLGRRLGETCVMPGRRLLAGDGFAPQRQRIQRGGCQLQQGRGGGFAVCQPAIEQALHCPGGFAERGQPDHPAAALEGMEGAAQIG